ncbi:hypothetical protein C8Q80DRAFT_207147 [Daedaleopsis nitida]|nr:hypothetical protein C8Q80DRAFT_207147 [Daedaleopsis nitida]
MVDLLSCSRPPVFRRPSDRKILGPAWTHAALWHLRPATMLRMPKQFIPPPAFYSPDIRCNIALWAPLLPGHVRGSQPHFPSSPFLLPTLTGSVDCYQTSTAAGGRHDDRSALRTRATTLARLDGESGLDQGEPPASTSHVLSDDELSCPRQPSSRRARDMYRWILAPMDRVQLRTRSLSLSPRPVGQHAPSDPHPGRPVGSDPPPECDLRWPLAGPMALPCVWSRAASARAASPVVAPYRHLLCSSAGPLSQPSLAPVRRRMSYAVAPAPNADTHVLRRRLVVFICLFLPCPWRPRWRHAYIYGTCVVWPSL